VRAALVALSLAVLLAAAVLAARDRRGSEAALPAWVTRDLEGLTVRPADAEALSVARSFATRAVVRAVFLDDPPAAAPLVVPILASGRFARGPLPVSPTGSVDIRTETDVPAWLVAWQGLDGRALSRQGTWRDGARVDAVFLVDGITGDCCFVARFLPDAAAGAR
jgi:hypothetical protein